MIMKNLSILFVLTLFLASCKNEPKQPEGYMVTGNAPGIYNGIRAYLSTPDARGRKVPADTAIVMNESFTFEGKVDNAGMYFLTIDNIPGSLQLILGNDDITVNLDKSNILKSQVTGSNATDLYNTFNDNLKKKQLEIQSLRVQQRTASYSKQPDLAKSLGKEIAQKNEELQI